MKRPFKTLVQLKQTTITKLKYLKLKHDLSSYDEVIVKLINERRSR